MDHNDYTTPTGRKKGQHLTKADRVLIEICHKDGLSNRAIARKLNCSPSTGSNELKRGTPPKTGTRGRATGYKALTGDGVCHENRERCRRPYRVSKCTEFVTWMVTQIFNEGAGQSTHASVMPNACISDDEMICTKTVYKAVWGAAAWQSRPLISMKQ